MIPNFTFALGYMSMSLLSFWIPDWRQLTFVLAALSFPFLLTWWFWPESPRWLYSVGKYEEGEKVISTFVKKCNADLSDFSDPDGPTTNSMTNERRFLDTLRKKCIPEEDTNVPEVLKEDKNYSVLTLFSSGRHLALTSANVAFQFVVIVMAYYGLSYGAGDLPGDIYVNNVINGAVEVAAYVATFFLLNILGRRLLLGGPMLLSGGVLKILKKLGPVRNAGRVSGPKNRKIGITRNGTGQFFLFFDKSSTLSNDRKK